MGANRYSATFKNLGTTEVDWLVEIYDDLGTPVGTFNTSGPLGPENEMERPSKDPIPGIYPTQWQFPLMVENAQHEALISDLYSKDRSRFAMRVYRDSVLYFVGRFAIDEFRYPNASMPYPFVIAATDSLASLKSIDYNNAGSAYSGVASFMEHIQNCFDKLDVQTFYGGDFISFAFNWYHSDMPNMTKTPFEYAGVDHVACTMLKECTTLSS